MSRRNGVQGILHRLSRCGEVVQGKIGSVGIGFAIQFVSIVSSRADRHGDI